MADFSLTSLVSLDHITLPNQPERVTVGSCGFYLSLALARFGARTLFVPGCGENLDKGQLAPLIEAGAEVLPCVLPGKTAYLKLVYGETGHVTEKVYEEGGASVMRYEHLPSHFSDARVVWLGTAPQALLEGICEHLPADATVYISTQNEFAGRTADLLRLLPHVRCLFANTRELNNMGFGGVNAAVAALLEANPRLQIIVTRGERGAWRLSANECLNIGAIPNPIIVNTTGAGDTFSAGYAWRTLQGDTPAQALQWASVAATLSLRGYAYWLIPTAAQVEAYAAEVAALPLIREQYHAGLIDTWMDENLTIGTH